MNEQVTKHTPGPWVWNGKDMPFADIEDARGNVIAGMNESVRHDAQQARAEERANARLIAAAPELLAALRMVIAHDGRLTGADWDTIRAAVDKAEGGAA